MKFGLLLIMLAFGSKQIERKGENAKTEKTCKENITEDLILVKIEDDEYAKVQRQTSQYIGVSQNKERKAKWRAMRWNKNEMKTVYNGYYKDEETAAHASDTLARKLMANGKQNLKLNFPDDKTEVYPKNVSSHYIGVSYREKYSRWYVSRFSKKENKVISNGYYKGEEAAAHASDTLARKLMSNGEENLKLNFPDDDTEVYPEEKSTSSNYFGVSYNKKSSKWYASRWSKKENKHIYNGCYKDEAAAAHASDTLARKLMKIGEQNRKLNFTDDDYEVHSKNQRIKRKRSDCENLKHSQNK